MGPTKTSLTLSRPRRKVGEDGLTSSQRYYQNHKEEVRRKNRECARQQREEQKEIASSKAPRSSEHCASGSIRSKGSILDTPRPRSGSCQTPSDANSTVPSQENASGVAIACETVPSRMDSRKLPRDFFLNRQQNRCAAFGHAIQVLQDSRFEDPIPPGTQALDRADKLRHAVLEWASGWGGVAYWEIGLNRSYTNAVEEGRVDEWQEQLLNHASLGRRLLSQYTNLRGTLPNEPHKIKELWRVTVEMVELLVMGITIINTRCSVLPHLWQVEKIPTPAWSEESGSERSSGDSDEADEEDNSDTEKSIDGSHSGDTTEDDLVDPQSFLARIGDDGIDM